MEGGRRAEDEACQARDRHADPAAHDEEGSAVDVAGKLTWEMACGCHATGRHYGDCPCGKAFPPVAAVR